MLLDGLGNPITAVPFPLGGSSVTYSPDLGFQGSDGFGYEASIGDVVDAGFVTVFVNFLDCETSAEGCDDGR